MTPKNSLLQDGLLTALRALDNQIMREMQRTPLEREDQGVQKWEPYQKRIEELTSYLLDLFGDRTINLDSLIILSQVLPKALSLIVRDLGSEGLGNVRSGYCSVTFETIKADIIAAQNSLNDKEVIN